MRGQKYAGTYKMNTIYENKIYVRFSVIHFLKCAILFDLNY